MAQRKPDVPERPRRILLLAAGAVVLLLAVVWAVQYFSAEARVRRATVRVVRLAEKPGEESPVALGMAAHRLGNVLATNAVLDLEGYGNLATGRLEILQLFSRIRASLAQIAFEDSLILVLELRRGEVRAQVEAHYRLAPETGVAAEGDGVGILIWNRGDGGWKITNATLRAEEGAVMPAAWK